jgi:outer membrane murein-binding lipoprotein Lpp
MAGAQDAGSIFSEVRIRIDKLSGDVKSVNTKLDQLGKDIQTRNAKTQKSFKDLFGQIGISGAAAIHRGRI